MFPNNNSPGFEVVYTTCNANFYDTGGVDGPYDYGENSIATFCPPSNGESIRITFNLFDLQASHVLTVYDGDSDSAPVIGSFLNVFMDMQEYVFIASNENPTGCLTVTFNVPPQDSAPQQPYEGWEAQIGCVPCVYPEVSNPQDIAFCNDGNGSATIDLFEESLLSQITSDQTNTVISFHENLQDANTAQNAITDSYTFDESEVIFIRVEDVLSGCASYARLNLIFDELPDSDLLTEYVACVDDTGELIEGPIVMDTGLGNSEYDFQWFYEGNSINEATNAELEASQIGQYSVLITNSDTNCEVELFTEILPNETTIDYQININPSLFAETKSVEIVVAGNGEFNFSLNNTEFNSTGLFENVPPGPHTIRISQDEACSDVEVEIFIIDFPNFFTPNGDGYNDYWSIRSGDSLENVELYIFDRYGKLISQIDIRQIGWDGTYNGRVMPPSEYWFLIKYEYNNKRGEFNGHFSLMR